MSWYKKPDKPLKETSIALNNNPNKLLEAGLFYMECVDLIHNMLIYKKLTLSLILDDALIPATPGEKNADTYVQYDELNKIGVPLIEECVTNGMLCLRMYGVIILPKKDYQQHIDMFRNKVKNASKIKKLNTIITKQPLKEKVVHRTFTKHEHMVMKWCSDLASLSYCERAQMGAIIMVDEKTFITGYNGTLEGFENKCDEMSLVCNVCNVAVDPDDYAEGEKHCKKGIVEKRPKSTLNVIHAETNAIFHAGVNGVSIAGKTMCMTTSPCPTCANNIVKAKIGRVIYENDHDDLRGLETLRRAGVEVIKYG